MDTGTVRKLAARTEVWSGGAWISARAALEEMIVEFEDVAELVRNETVGGGAYGGPSEYTIAWRIWRLDDQWVLDQSEDGLDDTYFDSLEACESEWQRQLDELGSDSGDENDDENDDDETDRTIG